MRAAAKDFGGYSGIHDMAGKEVGARPGSRARSAFAVARRRLAISILVFGAAFAGLSVRILDLGLAETQRVAALTPAPAAPTPLASRSDIVDRNGIVLASSLEVQSLYANPKEVLDPADAARKLVSALPDLAYDDLYRKLTEKRSFVWLKRQLAPREVFSVNTLGIPGLAFQKEEVRVYPQGSLFAHVLGYVDTDGNGLGGVEHSFDKRLKDRAAAGQPLRLAVDVRVQQALRDEIASAMTDFQAVGGAGIVMDAHNGEVVGMVSLPDFDPNHASTATPDQRFNRASQGVYELGSVMKAATFAAAFESNAATMQASYDATEPIRIAGFTIHDDHPKRRVLTVPEIFQYSSNIGTAKMAMDLGAGRLRQYLSAFGLMERSPFEISEVGTPLVPRNWGEVETMTVSFGHGVAVSPIQAVTAFAGFTNGGILPKATILKTGTGARGRRIVSEATSEKMRALFRLVVEAGTARKADAPGYDVGGKTGTAEKPGAHGYNHDALISTFIGVYPVSDPRYVVMIALDEPKGNASTFGFKSGGWVAAPGVRNVITRTAPILGVEPRPAAPPSGLIEAALPVDD